jgi:hypothetical protein
MPLEVPVGHHAFIIATDRQTDTDNSDVSTFSLLLEMF